jgi:hypothetical protein
MAAPRWMCQQQSTASTIRRDWTGTDDLAERRGAPLHVRLRGKMRLHLAPAEDGFSADPIEQQVESALGDQVCNPLSARPIELCCFLHGQQIFPRAGGEIAEIEPIVHGE